MVAPLAERIPSHEEFSFANGYYAVIDLIMTRCPAIEEKEGWRRRANRLGAGRQSGAGLATPRSRRQE
jgi:hypothetical protein